MQWYCPKQISLTYQPECREQQLKIHPDECRETNNMTTTNRVTRPLRLLNLLLILSTVTVLPSATATNLCGTISIEHPFTLQKTMEPPGSSPQRQIVLLCRSDKLYLRASTGIFLVSSIDYKIKHLAISHGQQNSSSQNFSSLLFLSAGFPSSSQPNSVITINCKIPTKPMFPIVKNCSWFHNSNQGGQSGRSFQSQWVNDANQLGTGSDHTKRSCSHYFLAHRKILGGNLGDQLKQDVLEPGTKVTVNVPNHVPNICVKCKDPNQICGAALRCFCHPKECSEKVINRGVSSSATWNVIITTFLCTVSAFVYD